MSPNLSFTSTASSCPTLLPCPDSLAPPPGRAQAINNFCREIGVTRSEGEVHLHKLDHHIRSELDAGSRRALGVLRPLRVVISNLEDAHYEEVEAKVGGAVVVGVKGLKGGWKARPSPAGAMNRGKGACCK